MALLDTLTTLTTSKGVFALVGIVMGGLGAKVVEWLRDRNLKKLDEAATIRAELWKELGALRAEINDLRDEVSEWKEKYFKVLSDYTSLEGRYSALKDQLERFVKGNEKS